MLEFGKNTEVAAQKMYAIWFVAFLSDSKMLVAGIIDKTDRLWHIVNKSEVTTTLRGNLLEVIFH